MDLKKWKDLSDKLFHRRSSELQQVDQAVQQFEASNSLSDLKTLARNIMKWQAVKQNWLSDSIRSDPMRQLVNEVKSSAATLWPKVGGQIFNRLHCDEQLAAMQSKPNTWLHSHPLRIAGTSNEQVQDFFLTMDTICDPTYEPAPIPACGKILGGKLVYKIANCYDWGTKLNSTMAIKMHSDFDSNSTAMDVTKRLTILPNHANYMVTGQLSACTFVIDDAGPQLRCTHLQPVGQGGDQLDQQVSGFGLTNTTVYGSTSYKPASGTRVSIIGFSKGGWEIYAQSLNGNKIVKTEQIY